MPLTDKEYQEAKDMLNKKNDEARINRGIYHDGPKRKLSSSECERAQYLWNKASEKQQCELRDLQLLIDKSC